jgi:vacuolar-type H+-ATPase subunit I/STV1
MQQNHQQNQQQNHQQNQQQNQHHNVNGNGMPQPPSLVFVQDSFSQLRRDWEHAFHVQSLHGRGTEHLQRLMHSQFTFLEHIVLDVSKQCHSLQDQFIAERNANMKLLNRIEEIQKHSSSINGPIIELENKFIKLDANQQLLKQQLLNQSMNPSANRNPNPSPYPNINHEALLQSVSAKMTAEIDVLRKELADLKLIIENENQEKIREKQQKANDKSILDTNLDCLKNQITSIHVEIESTRILIQETRDKIEQTASNLERQFLSHKQSHHNEQQTILSVIKTMSNNISTLRKELHRLDSKSLAKLEEFKDLILARVNTVTRPLIVH